MQLSPISLAITRLGGVRFSPSALFSSGEQGAWYDPSDSSTLFSDTAGTTPCAAPGAGALVNVGRMLDKSGNGNHAISYNATTARPELSARTNLLTYSEQFDNAAWVKQNSSVVANATTAPNGTLSAYKLNDTTTLAQHRLDQTPVSSAGVQTLSVYAKAAEFGYVGLRIGLIGAGFNLSNGTVSELLTGATASVQSLGNGWYRCIVTCTAAANDIARINIADATSSAPSYAGTGTSGIFIWGADLRPTNIGANVPAYQRIADQYTYDTVGFPRYLRFDGVDDGMSTPANLNLSATDKATVFAGVRKQSDTTSILAEFSANVGVNNGAFSVVIGSPSYSFSLRATAETAFTATSFTAPISNVISCVNDTTGATRATEVFPRINGVIPTLTGAGAAESGSGNLGTYPLNIGTRNAAGGAPTTLFFNGYIYSLIVVGAASTAAQISSTESWINVKEGGVY